MRACLPTAFARPCIFSSPKVWALPLLGARARGRRAPVAGVPRMGGPDGAALQHPVPYGGIREPRQRPTVLGDDMRGPRSLPGRVERPTQARGGWEGSGGEIIIHLGASAVQLPLQTDFVVSSVGFSLVDRGWVASLSASSLGVFFREFMGWSEEQSNRGGPFLTSPLVTPRF